MTIGNGRAGRRLRVKNGSRGLAAGCLLCPGERTSSDYLGMTEKCRWRTCELGRELKEATHEVVFMPTRQMSATWR